MTIIVSSVEAGGCVIQMLIETARQARLVHRFFLGMKILVPLDQQVGERAFRYLYPNIFEKLDDLRLAHQPAMIQRNRQRLDPWTKLSPVARWQFCQIGATQRR